MVVWLLSRRCRTAWEAARSGDRPRGPAWRQCSIDAGSWERGWNTANRQLPGRAPCRVLKLLSEDPSNYPDAPREGIRRVLEEVTGVPHPRCGASGAGDSAWPQLPPWHAHRTPAGMGAVSAIQQHGLPHNRSARQPTHSSTHLLAASIRDRPLDTNALPPASQGQAAGHLPHRQRAHGHHRGHQCPAGAQGRALRPAGQQGLPGPAAYWQPGGRAPSSQRALRPPVPAAGCCPLPSPVPAAGCCPLRPPVPAAGCCPRQAGSFPGNVGAGRRRLHACLLQSRPHIFDLEIKTPDNLYEVVVEVDEQVILPLDATPGARNGAAAADNCT